MMYLFLEILLFIDAIYNERKNFYGKVGYIRLVTLEMWFMFRQKKKMTKWFGIMLFVRFFN